MVENKNIVMAVNKMKGLVATFLLYLAIKRYEKNRNMLIPLGKASLDVAAGDEHMESHHRRGSPAR